MARRTSTTTRARRGEEGEEAAAAAPAPKRRTRVSDRPAAGGGEKEEAKPEPLGEKGWEELQAKRSSRCARPCACRSSTTTSTCGVYMLKFIDQAANDAEALEHRQRRDAPDPLPVADARRFRPLVVSGPSEKIDGRVIDELRMTIRDAISQTGTEQQSAAKDARFARQDSGAAKP